MYNWIYLIVTVLIATMPQLGVMLWWGSSINSKVKQLEKDYDKLYDEVDSMAKLEIRIAVVESILLTQTHVLEEIRDSLKGKLLTA